MIYLTIGAPVTPPSVHQARALPAECATTVAPVAIHRAEKLFAVLDHLSITSEWIGQFPRRRLGSTRPKVRLISDRQRDGARVVRAATSERQGEYETHLDK